MTSNENISFSELRLSLKFVRQPTKSVLAVLQIKNGDNWKPLDQTGFLKKTSKDRIKKRFNHKLRLDFSLVYHQKFRIIFLCNEKKEATQDFSFIQFTLGELSVKHGGKLVKNLISTKDKKKSKQQIFIQTFEVLQRRKKINKPVAFGRFQFLEIDINNPDLEIKLTSHQVNSDKKIKTKANAILKLMSIEKLIQPTIFEILCGGYQISPVFAIDFTISNGQVEYENSLHHQNGKQDNLYEQIISLMGKSLLQFKSGEKVIPAFGFGAKVDNNEKNSVVSNCFPLNGNVNNPECEGVEGVLSAYKQSLEYVTLYGPGNVSGIIRGASSLNHEMTKTYTVLIIVTDGVPSDMKQTKMAIENSSLEKVSIIFICIGDQDFTELNYFLNNKKKLRNNIIIAKYDESMQNNPNNFLLKTFSQLTKQIIDSFQI
ncbi:copine [Anaeramoeba flamelloides]|uniref:Copine n=1 Tax=Anaeramoeba flamelloides TaxID=1746091 RepID=A0ABQ8YDM7_9EUKA|nr:copine [Anaeramoeba flamelloides]